MMSASTLSRLHCGSALLLSLITTTLQAQSTGPWVASPGPFANAGVSSTSVQTLQIVEPATVWGWSQMSGAGGASSSTLAVTSNDGQTWQPAAVAAKVRTGISSFSGTVALDAWMTDDQHAWVLTQDVETSAITLKRTSTGLSNLSAGAAPANAAKIRFFSSSTGVVIGNTATAWTLYRTTDGGATWAPLNLTLPHLANDQPHRLTLLGASLWLTTTQGQLLRTADAGQTWTSSTPPTNGLPAAVAFRSTTDGLLLTSDKQLLRTADAGLSWQVVAATGVLRKEGLVAIPGSTGTYLSFDGICNGPSCPIQGSSISTDNGVTWRELENSIYHTTMAAGAGPRAWTSSYSQANLYRSTTLLTGTTAAIAKSALLAWPNPSTGRLHFAPQPQARVVTLVDATGRTAATYPLPAQATTLELAGCSPGLYVLKCLVGNQLHTQRLVVTAP